jgi:integrase
MPRKRDLRGIETRLTTSGREQYRPYVTDPANRHRKIRGHWTAVFAEAKGWRVQTLAKLENGVSVVPPKAMPTVREASDRFIDGARSGLILSRKRERYAAKTLRGYEQSFRDWINPELGDIRVDALKRSDVQRFLDGVAMLRAGSTARNVIHALGALYSYLLPRHDEIGHDPTVGLEKPRAAGPRERYAERGEMLALLGALPHPLDVPYALAFRAGLRRAEIQSLPIDCIDLDAGWLDVRYSLDVKDGFKGPKSGAGERSIPIFDDLRPYLVRQIAETAARIGHVEPSTDERPGTLLLPSTRASRWGTQEFGTPYGKLCRKAWGWKLDDDDEWVPATATSPLQPIGLHEARHSFATSLVRAGYDVKLVSEWIGHAQASTTLNIYAKHRGRTGDAYKLAERMNQHLAGAA